MRGVETLSDDEAMSRVADSGDSHAFASLMARWQTPLRRLCARMTGDEHRAEELTQEAFLRAFAQRKSYERRAKVSTYLWRIALNLCRDEHRRKRRANETSLDAEGEQWAESLQGNEESPTTAMIRHEQGEAVRDAVALLPECYRSVVVLRHYEGLKFREIAEVLDIPEGTVKSRMAEALTKLAKSLSSLED